MESCHCVPSQQEAIETSPLLAKIVQRAGYLWEAALKDGFDKHSFEFCIFIHSESNEWYK